MTTQEITDEISALFGSDTAAFQAFLLAAKAAVDLSRLENEKKKIQKERETAITAAQTSMDSKQAEIDAQTAAILASLS